MEICKKITLFYPDCKGGLFQEKCARHVLNRGSILKILNTQTVKREKFIVKTN